MYDVSPSTNKLYEIYVYDGPTWTLQPDVSVRRPLPSCAFVHARRLYKFTGKERDSESNLDYFHARHYSSPLGRFIQPDEFAAGPEDPISGETEPPGPLPFGDINNPQSLNRYSYTYNNPVRYSDPNGHCVEDLCVAEGLAVAALTSYLLTPQGQQMVKNGVTAAAGTAASVANTLFAKSVPPSTASPGQKEQTFGEQLPGNIARELGDLKGGEAISSMKPSEVDRKLDEMNRQKTQERDPAKRKELQKEIERLKKAQKKLKQQERIHEKTKSKPAQPPPPHKPS